MNEKGSSSDSGWLTSLKGKIVSLTALCLVVPALINSAFDIYKAGAHVSADINEAVNEKLFRTHFKHTPLRSELVKFADQGIAVEMLIEIYDNGDIFVKYGEFQQWFPFRHLKIGDALVGEAYAGGAGPSSSTGGGAATPTVLPSILQRRLYDLGKLRIEATDSSSETIERLYTLSESKEDHPSLFSSSRQNYSTTFQAQPGYRITKHDFQLVSANGFELRSIDVGSNSSEVRISFSLTSGPALDRWRGWVKGTLRTVQERFN